VYTRNSHFLIKFLGKIKKKEFYLCEQLGITSFNNPQIAIMPPTNTAQLNHAKYAFNKISTPNTKSFIPIHVWQ
jgi:hypothetical protein